MTTFFVSRHPGAIVWAKRKDLNIDFVVPHLDPCVVNAGDTVLGTLPLPMVANVCARGARYLHLSVCLPADMRGQELRADQLEALGARLLEYSVQQLGVTRLQPVTPQACQCLEKNQARANFRNQRNEAKDTQ